MELNGRFKKVFSSKCKDYPREILDDGDISFIKSEEDILNQCDLTVNPQKCIICNKIARSTKKYIKQHLNNIASKITREQHFEHDKHWMSKQ